MDFILLLTRVGLATLFISTAWSKLRKFEEHIVIVKEYNILPRKWVRHGATLEMVIELILGLMLLIGLFQTSSLILSILLLFVYCMAIGINLLRGRSDISCGCGGMAGDHSLSWWLVLRNVALIGLCLWLIKEQLLLGTIDSLLSGRTWVQSFTTEVFVATFTFWAVTLLLFIISFFRNVSKQMNELVS